MKILYVAGYTSEAFRLRHGDLNPPSVAGSRKVGFVARVLRELGHDVLILSSAMLGVSRLRWRPALMENFEAGDERVRTFYPGALMLRPFGGLLNCLRARRIVRHILGNYVPDLVVVYNTYLFEALAAAELITQMSAPMILQIEDLPLARKREWLNIKPRLDNVFWRRMLNQASAFTTVNSDISLLLPKNKPKWLMPGVIDDLLIAESERRIPAFTGAARTVGYFGELSEGKGVKVLLELMECMPKNWRLIVTGGGPLADAFKSSAARHPARLSFLGRIPEADLYKTMCSCDCTIIPREQITSGGQGVFPMKAFEYIVANTHIISTSLPKVEGFDISFFQRWDGRMGTLASKLEESTEDYRRETESRARTREKIISCFGFKGWQRAYSDIILQAMKA